MDNNVDLAAVREEPESLEAFLARWRTRLRSMSTNLLGAGVASRADTSDVVQEGLLQAWQHLDGFRGDSAEQVQAWMRRIGTGQAAKIRRYHLAEKRSVRAEQSMPQSSIPSATSPPELAEYSETQAILLNAIDDLDDRSRTVVLLRVFEGESFPQIAERLGCSVSLPRVVFAAAIKQLRGQLVEQGLGDSE